MKYNNVWIKIINLKKNKVMKIIDECKSLKLIKNNEISSNEEK